ncbi:MAG: MotA/TolQ/ExbB proton channel family protein [Deltaproteobacteria bacterium]|nr:MotA/TolQ/ExbB proton channel family protein [Deltaproteobacteria bacterium]MBW2020125.1 MotA/TolQ/ExbB proton channel family protein [Deltaproteobacteria bacterium]MBW2074978.1 MotA/TolQ/ExbB proton channel family protein [Deltaproteobacteria bacterium]
MFDLFQKGGIIMYPLLACSLVSLTVILERSLFWIREKRRADNALVDQVLELARLRKYEEIRTNTQGSADYVVRVLVCGLVHREYSLSKAMEMAALEELKRMKTYLPVLDTMITAAPLLGILGTVIGIIHSFDMLGRAGIQDPQAVTTGIAQALITTAAGLLIAIFTLFPYNYFMSKVEKAAVRIEKYATSLEIVHGGDIRK